MEIKVGDKLENITLPAIDDTTFEYNSVKGKKVLLTFYRFAACPMCNLRINELVKSYNSFGKNFIHVAIFDSSLENLSVLLKGTMLHFLFLRIQISTTLINMKLKDPC